MDVTMRARPADTTPEIWAAQMARLASMTPEERLRVADRLSADCRRLREASSPAE